MISKSCISSACRILLLGAVFLFAFGALSPQQAVARLDLERSMPVSDGDPEDGWDYNGGGGGENFPPPEEESNGFNGRNFYSLDIVQRSLGSNSVGTLLITPYFNGKYLVWFITILPVKGGLN